VPFPCSYQLWTDGNHLGEHCSWAVSGLPPLFWHLLGVGLPLSAEGLKDPKDVVATHHHFSTACAEKSPPCNNSEAAVTPWHFLCKSTCFLEKSGTLYSMPDQDSPDALLLHSRAAFSLLILSCETSVTHGNPKSIFYLFLL